MNALDIRNNSAFMFLYYHNFFPNASQAWDSGKEFVIRSAFPWWLSTSEDQSAQLMLNHKTLLRLNMIYKYNPMNGVSSKRHFDSLFII